MITARRSMGDVVTGSAPVAARATRAPSGGAGHDTEDGSVPVQSSSATASKLALRARPTASCPLKSRRSPWISVIDVASDTSTVPTRVVSFRGRPRRASDSTSEASNWLVRPSAASVRCRTPRLT